MIQLYAIHDDKLNTTDYHERWWCAVWAMSLDEAIDVAAKNYGGDYPATGCRQYLAGDFANNQDRLSAFAPENPGTIEHRCRVLRLAGWRDEGEATCDTCGLASLGMEEFEVCSECYQCKECGCECEKARGEK